ncbi:MAG: flagellin lysine-N-methylase, partial [Lachnospiraceae bacterium]|nr:flagellin lysine-N-methylase [Lachnospiraceae bacterium]
YTYPEYLYDFQCDASACSDTCCVGWNIMIDPVSLKKYRKYPGFFGNRLKNSIDWEKESFEQYNGRCAFLNEENLCDIYTEAGEDMLCKTCTRYPRHYEEYENLREISLSLSCPAAARMVLGQKEQLMFLNEYRETPEEEYEQFDFFLFTKLNEIRDYFYRVIQDRDRSVAHRMAMILCTAHDLQKRIDRAQLHEVDDLLKRYQKPSFWKTAEKKFALYENRGVEKRIQRWKLWQKLYRLEVLRPRWREYLKKQEEYLYQDLSQEIYEKAWQEFADTSPDRAVEYEQLLMYYIFCYLCGAVYDEDLFSKVKLAVVHTMLIQEMDFGVWLSREKGFSFEDQVELVHRYARETEHSDPNMEAMECMAAEDEAFCLEKLLRGVLG